MKENLAVYETLRNEIISMEEQRRNVWLYMYLLYISLFVLGMQWNFRLFLVTYIVILPYQMVINDYNWSITKMSTYIRYFIENEYEDINWESLHCYEKFLKYSRKRQSKIVGRIRYTGSTQLGLLSTIFFIIYCILQYGKEIPLLDVIWIVISVVLFICTLVTNMKYTAAKHEELEEIIESYRRDIIRRNSSKT